MKFKSRFIMFMILVLGFCVLAAIPSAVAKGGPVSSPVQLPNTPAKDDTVTLPQSTAKNDDGDTVDESDTADVPDAIAKHDDKDGDGIIDDDDFCPTEEAEINKGTLSKASIILFDLSDPDIINLFQETIDLHAAFVGYDYKVLLYDTRDTLTSAISGAKAIREADVVEEPSVENLYASIKDLVRKGYAIDLWIFSHGELFLQDDGDGSYFKDFGYSFSTDPLTATEIRESFSPEVTGCNELPIRMVYTIACYGAQTNQAWIDVGAKTTVGSTSVNFFPTQFKKFASGWTGGKTVRAAAAAADTASSRTMVHLYIETQALMRVVMRGDCGLIPDVLGKTDCAEWYFTNDEGYGYNIGLVPDVYDNSLSGKDNMRRSSTKIIGGTGSLRFDSDVEWE